MKNLVLLLLAFILIGSEAISQTKEYKRYSLKSGIVKYTIDGMQKGSAELYFDNWGMKEATYENSVIEMYGIKQESETVNYLDGYWQYNVDKQSNTGTKTKNTVLESIVENSEDGDLVVIGQQMFTNMGGKKIGSGEVIGKPCEIWELESVGTKVWVWENIPLKTETNMMGMTLVREATSIETDADIPEGKLDIPTDIEFNEIDLNSIQNMMNGQ